MRLLQARYVGVAATGVRPWLIDTVVVFTVLGSTKWLKPMRINGLRGTPVESSVGNCEVEMNVVVPGGGGAGGGVLPPPPPPPPPHAWTNAQRAIRPDA